MYLSIRHKAKWRYDFLYPSISSIIVGTFVLYGPLDLNISGDRGLLDQANSLVGILVGFFIAALAAVATFDRPSMDKPMAGTPPTLTIVEKKKAYEIQLSRRAYLSQLFGYLTVISIVTYTLGSLAQAITFKTIHLGDPKYYWTAKVIFMYVYMFLMANVIVNTLLGVFYLSYRIHDLGSKRV